jgi:hypothetical protein
MNRLAFGTSCVLVMGLAFPLSVGAQSFNKQGATAQWGPAANWTPPGTPTNGSDVFIGLPDCAAEVILDISYTAPGIKSLRIDGKGAGKTLKQPAGHSMTVADAVIIGDAAGGAYVQEGNVTHIGSSLILGNKKGSAGAYLMKDGHLELMGLETNGSLIVGRGGNGSFNLVDGHVTTNGITVGFADNDGPATGLMNQSGGTVKLAKSYSLFVGRQKGLGSYELSGKGKLEADSGNIQLGTGGGKGSFIQNGGEVLLTSPKDNKNSGHVFLGNEAADTGEYLLNAGTLKANVVWIGGDASKAGGKGTLQVRGKVDAGVRVYPNGVLIIYDGGVVNAGTHPSDGVLNEGTIIQYGTGQLNAGGGVSGPGLYLKLP